MKEVPGCWNHPAPSSVTANPLFLGMPITELPLLPVSTFGDPVEAEAVTETVVLDGNLCAG